MFSLSTCLAGRPKLFKEKKPDEMKWEEENRQVHSRACGVGRRPRPRKVGSSWAMRAMKIWSRFTLWILLLTLEKAFWGITPQFVNHAAITKKLFFPEWHQNFYWKDSLGIKPERYQDLIRNLFSRARCRQQGISTFEFPFYFDLFCILFYWKFNPQRWTGEWISICSERKKRVE